MAIFFEYGLTCIRLTPGTWYEKISVVDPVRISAVTMTEPVAALTWGVLRIIDVPVLAC